MTTSDAKPRNERKEGEERERRRAAGEEAEEVQSTSSSDEEQGEGDDGTPAGRGYLRLGDAPPAPSASEDDGEDN